ncbi:MAG: hypothetical protein U0271_44105 [Polyangiaceae bacterium]
MSEESSAEAGGTPPPRQFKPPIRNEAPAEPRPRGLNAVEASRVQRNKIKRPPLRVIVWFSMTLVVALALYFRWESSRNEALRNKIMAKQRAVDSELGPRWYPLRDKVEGWTIALANGDPPKDVLERDELANFKFQELPGLYLRLRADQAKDAGTVRKAAQESLRDGFTACLMRNPNEVATEGKDCTKSKDCDPGSLCNEYFHCSKPGQPYNLRLAYRALFMLTPEWVDEVRKATNDLQLRAYDLAIDDANSIEFPIAVELLTKAQFFLVVVDEKPAPAPVSSGADAGVTTDDVDAIEGRTYPSRVGLYRLSDGKELIKLRREGRGKLIGSAPADDHAAAARARQAQSCSLALDVREALGDTTVK